MYICISYFFFGKGGRLNLNFKIMEFVKFGNLGKGCLPCIFELAISSSEKGED